MTGADDYLYRVGTKTAASKPADYGEALFTGSDEAAREMSAWQHLDPPFHEVWIERAAIGPWERLP
jgi:hypothetical protein